MKRQNRRGRLPVLPLFLLFFAAACGKNGETARQEELLEAERGLFRYEVGYVDQMAVDDDGLVYTVTRDNKPVKEQDTELARTGTKGAAVVVGAEPEDPEPEWPEEEEEFQVICIYGLDGSLVEQHRVKLANGSVSALYIEEGILYLAADKSRNGKMAEMLYAVSVDTWEAKELFVLEGYQRASKITKIGDYVYCFGVLSNPQAKLYTLYPGVYVYNYGGEAVCRFSALEENPQAELLPVDFPIDMAKTTQDTLVIEQYTEDNGFGFLEFDPGRETFSVACFTGANMAREFTMCEDRGYVFYRNGTIYYGTLDGMEAELTDGQLRWAYQLKYQKGFVFYVDLMEETVCRFCSADIIQENRVVRFLLHEDAQDLPFGCGYRMEKTVLPSDQYAMKVLAQDRDFDFYLLSSRNPEAYNLRKNGAFYALNDVEGVQEYLDACFPYVKEAAVNEDGDIWMIPVKLAIPWLLYDKASCAAEGFAAPGELELSEFLEKTGQYLAERPEQVSVSLYVVIEELFGQYLEGNDTFDTPQFRAYAQLLKGVSDSLEEWLFLTEISRIIMEESGEPFLYEYNVYQNSLFHYVPRLIDSTEIGVCGMAKMNEGSGNYGTLTFLMVNPQSANLEATLSYLTTFCRYMLEQTDSLMLADRSTYTDTPFMRELYEVFANGSIGFAMEREVYWNRFVDYLNGEIGLEELVTEIERRRALYVGE